MSEVLLNAPLQQMAYEWLTANGVNFQGTCQLLHDGPCISSTLKKSILVGAVGYKYYISFHLIPLVLRLRKCKSREEVLKLFRKSSIEYARSVLFMIFLVVGMKMGQCITVKTNTPFLERELTGFCFLSAGSILLEQSGRRKEIGYFVMAKALRSCYKGLKRLGYVSIGNEFMVMHVCMMSAIYYIYNHHPDMLKFKNIFEMVLGN